MRGDNHRPKHHASSYDAPFFMSLSCATFCCDPDKVTCTPNSFSFAGYLDREGALEKPSNAGGRIDESED